MDRRSYATGWTGARLQQPEEVSIRRLEPADAHELFRLRRLSLTAAPWAFASDPDSDRVKDIAAAVSILEDRDDQAVFGAFRQQLIGMVGLRRESHAKLRHRVYVWGMFVSEETRSAGIGRRLMQTAIAFSRDLGADWMDLSVADEASPAFKLYRSLGFVGWGTQEDALRYAGRSLSEHYCALDLRDPGWGPSQDRS